MRDYLLESWLKSRLSKNLGPPGNHGRGWSWIGSCLGAYILAQLHPEIKIKKGYMFPGTMLHEFMQRYVFPDGLNAAGLEILAHEQEVFIPMKYGKFRMSPIDTLVYDQNNNCFGVIDYKSAKPKNISWVENKAKDANIEQVNLYAAVFGAKWFMIIYVNKVNYDDFRIHRYNVDLDRSEKTIKKLRMVDHWLHDPEFQQTLPWTDLATGLTKLTRGNNPYRYICEPSERTPSYLGCPYKDFCLKRLSKQYKCEFSSMIRYDKYLKDHGLVNAT